MKAPRFIEEWLITEGLRMLPIRRLRDWPRLCHSLHPLSPYLLN